MNVLQNAFCLCNAISQSELQILINLELNRGIRIEMLADLKSLEDSIHNENRNIRALGKREYL